MVPLVAGSPFLSDKDKCHLRGEVGHRGRKEFIGFVGHTVGHCLIVCSLVSHYRYLLRSYLWPAIADWGGYSTQRLMREFCLQGWARYA